MKLLMHSMHFYQRHAQKVNVLIISSCSNVHHYNLSESHENQDEQVDEDLDDDDPVKPSITSTN